MLNTTETALITFRLNHHKQKRDMLLKQKKSERRGQLQETNTKISNLTRWLKNG